MRGGGRRRSESPLSKNTISKFVLFVCRRGEITFQREISEEDKAYFGGYFFGPYIPVMKPTEGTSEVPLMVTYIATDIMNTLIRVFLQNYTEKFCGTNINLMKLAWKLFDKTWNPLQCIRILIKYSSINTMQTYNSHGTRKSAEHSNGILYSFRFFPCQ